MKLSQEFIQEIKNVLTFYADDDNYWNEPLPLEKNYCNRTLKDVRESEKGNIILQDRGKKALELLDKLLIEEDPIMKYIAPICDTIITLKENE